MNSIFQVNNFKIRLAIFAFVSASFLILTSAHAQEALEKDVISKMVGKWKVTTTVVVVTADGQEFPLPESTSEVTWKSVSNGQMLTGKSLGPDGNTSHSVICWNGYKQEFIEYGSISTPENESNWVVNYNKGTKNTLQGTAVGHFQGQKVKGKVKVQFNAKAYESNVSFDYQEGNAVGLSKISFKSVATPLK